MKKMLYAVAMLAVVLVGCDKENDPEKQKSDASQKLTTGTAITQYLTASALVSNAVTESANGVGEVAADLKINVGPKSVKVDAEADTFPSVTWESVNEESIFPVIVTINYGTTNVLGKDGRNHRGVLKVWADGAYEEEGTTMKATFADWYVDDVKLMCSDSMTVVNNGRDDKNYCQFKVNGHFTLVSGEKSFEFTENSTRTWIEGEGQTDVTTHTYSIVGDQEGKTASKYDYSVKIAETDPMVVNVGTRFPLSGTLNITVDTRAIDEFFPNFEYAEVLKLLYPTDFDFTLIFTGDNKAKIQIPYTDVTTREEKTYESKEIDLLNI